MSFMKSIAVAAVAAIAPASGAAAVCGIETGNISVLANDFPALHAVVNWAKKCAGDGVSFSKNHTAEHRDLQVPALTPNPAEYTAVIVANSSIVPLLNNDLIRPLDDLVA